VPLRRSLRTAALNRGEQEMPHGSRDEARSARVESDAMIRSRVRL